MDAVKANGGWFKSNVNGFKDVINTVHRFHLCTAEKQQQAIIFDVKSVKSTRAN